jgi:hypothetical protein
VRFLVLWTLLSAVAAVIAWDKKRSPVLFFLLSFFLSPVVGIIAALTISRRTVVSSQHNQATRTCPACQAEARVSTTICPKCSAPLPPVIDVE